MGTQVAKVNVEGEFPLESPGAFYPEAWCGCSGESAHPFI